MTVAELIEALQQFDPNLEVWKDSGYCTGWPIEPPESGQVAGSGQVVVWI